MSNGIPPYLVAVKTSKGVTGQSVEELCREATVMAQVPQHPNIVSLIGVVTRVHDLGNPVMVLLLYCEHGSLDHYLRRCGESLDDQNRLRMVLDIASAMEHLVSRHLVHRDLASRNVLLDSQMTCKVGDFGLSRQTVEARTTVDTDAELSEGAEREPIEYYRSVTGTFPIRWTAPEAMETLKFTTATDVWSFGITVIEIYTNAAKPYSAMPNSEVMTAVAAGYRCCQAPGCSDEIYALLLRCWAENPAYRPSFTTIVSELTEIIGNAEITGGAYHRLTPNVTNAGSEFRPPGFVLV